MARIRTLKPEMAQDVKLASCTREARYTFVLLITQADDDGLVPGAHRQLLGLLYPHDEDVSAMQMLGWLAELENIGAIQWRSTVDGAPIIELTNWAKHQRVDNKGRSHLAGLLVPLAETRRESPRVAAVRRLDLGPGTKDLGGGAGADAPSAPPVVRVPRAARSSPVWVLEGVKWWLPTVGAMSPTKLQKALGGVVEVHGWAPVFADLQKWVGARKASGKAINVDWYAAEASSRITAPPPPPLVDANGCLTEYGERMTRPEKVPA